ncbi:hypothetical protein D3C72_1184090 [compost metagenome]
MVDDGNADAGGPAGRVAVHAHQPAHGLQDGVVAGQAAQRAVFAKARDGAVNQLRKAGLQVGFVVQPPFGHRAGNEVLDQHVGLFQQAQQHLAATWQGQVQPDGALAPVHRREVGGVAVRIDGRAQGARFVAGGRLDLDDAGALIRQHLGA